MKNCLTCKYEPDWGNWVGVVCERRVGHCKHPMVIPTLPSIYTITKRSVIRYDDDSGVERNCKMWEPKDS